MKKIKAEEAKDFVNKRNFVRLFMKNKYNGTIEITARAVILFRNKFLLCKNKKKNYLFFPGGHLNFGEKAIGALTRELKEEIGLSFKNWSFIGAVENVYIEDSQKHHEIILAFAVKI